MSALHLWLIALGGGLAFGPVILHLLMQEKPKRMVFPALRFVLQKQFVARRSMRLRHWLLLLLRMGLIALVALALARPAAATALFGSYLLLGVTIVSGLFFTFVLLFWKNRSGQNEGPPSRSTRANTATGFQSWPLALLGLVVAGHVVAAGYLSTQLWSGDTGPVLTGKQPVTAAIVVDTSPRMNYRFNNQTRLQRAQQLAKAIVEQLPAGSQLAVLDSGNEAPGLSLDIAAAGQQIDNLQTTYQSVTLARRARAALELLEESPLESKELYLISDLTRPSWVGEGRQIKIDRQDDEGITYLVDVGMKAYDNWSLSRWETPTPSITPGGVFRVNCTVTRAAADTSNQNLVDEVAADHLTSDDEPSSDADVDSANNTNSLIAANDTGLQPETRTVRLLIEKPQEGRPVYRDGKTITSDQYWERFTQVTLAPGQSMEVSFQVANLPRGEHQARIVVDGGDALPFDNQRYLTVRVEDAWPALIVAGPGVDDSNLVEAISPTELREDGQTSFNCKVVSATEIGTLVLGDYRVVFLLDPGPLSQLQWTQLRRYVDNGGSMAVFLGHNALNGLANKLTVDDSFLDPVARTLLPGKLEDPWRNPDGELALDPIAWDHPVFARMKNLRTQLVWGRLPIFMHFGLTMDTPTEVEQSGPSDQGADSARNSGDGGSPATDVAGDEDSSMRSVRVLATYTNNLPALCETTYGQGQVITLTTPITDPTRPEGRLPWNSFSVGNDWSFMYFLLINEISRYLATSQASSLNGEVGESFFINSDDVNDPQRYALFRPENQEPLDIQVEKGRLFVDFTDRPGSYHLTGRNPQNEVVQRGFSVNVPNGVSELTRVGKPQLDTILGRGRYLVAETEDQIIRNQGQGRVGLEFYPSLIRLLAVLFVCEMLFSNFFYRSPATASQDR